MAFFLRNPELDPTWKLFIATGFCGGLTTFSTFSLEIVTLMQSGQFFWAVSTVLAHLIGSLLMTFAGFWLVSLFV